MKSNDNLHHPMKMTITQKQVLCKGRIIFRPMMEI